MELVKLLVNVGVIGVARTATGLLHGGHHRSWVPTAKGAAYIQIQVRDPGERERQRAVESDELGRRQAWGLRLAAAEKSLGVEHSSYSEEMELQWQQQDVEPLDTNEEEDYTEGAEEKQAMDENPEGLYDDVGVDEQ
uniref:Uncharacterized protein n=1 Tax=Oryza brachyantha TaxID=4533 RepID=J3MW54_ORYBR